MLAHNGALHNSPKSLYGGVADRVARPHGLFEIVAKFVPIVTTGTIMAGKLGVGAEFLNLHVTA